MNTNVAIKHETIDFTQTSITSFNELNGFIEYLNYDGEIQRKIPVCDLVDFIAEKELNRLGEFESVIICESPLDKNYSSGFEELHLPPMKYLEDFFESVTEFYYRSNFGLEVING